MNFFYTLLSIIASFIVLGGLAIFIMNIASNIVYQFTDKSSKATARTIICIIVLTLIHVYIFLSMATFIILLVKGSTTDSTALNIILHVVATICVIFPAWIAPIQAKNKLNDPGVKKYEAMHVNVLHLNSLISSIAFIVMMIFPSLISYGWPWVESVSQKLL